MVALVNVRSVIAAVQVAFGHPAAAAVGWTGGSVVTSKARVPFLTSLAGMASLPLTVTAAGFWPGAALPPWLVQVVVGMAVAVSVISTSPLPRPASAPAASRVVPRSVNVGLPFLKCTLAAEATDESMAAATS